MILYFFIFIIIIFIPLLLSFWKRCALEREIYDETADFYQNQLISLKRDYQAQLIDDSHYENARVEIQRKILHHIVPAPPIGDTHSKANGLIILSILAVIPLFAAILYSIHGTAFFSAQSASAPRTDPNAPPLMLLKKLEDEALHLPPSDPKYFSKHLLLGELEAEMGLLDQAILHWKEALKSHFTPELAFHLADLQTQREGRISQETLKLYHQALDASPPQAPWRLALEARIAQGEHEQDQQTAP